LILANAPTSSLMSSAVGMRDSIEIWTCLRSNVWETIQLRLP
jgi:hypothetical protein